MKIAVTGATGFIGRNVVESHLSKNDEVNILTRQTGYSWQGVNCFFGDIARPSETLEKFANNVDILYNCAGEISDESKMYELHVNGIERLLTISKGRVGRWVQLSSVGAYGQHKDKIVTEQSQENPQNTYEWTKTVSDNLVINSGIDFNILRPSVVFGPGMPNQSLNTFIKMIRKGVYFFIGPKGYIVNYVHVNDVSRALILLGGISSHLNEVYILSQHTNVEGMVHALKRGMGINRTTLRLPEYPIRLISKVLELFPNPILTFSRIDNLTNRTIYSSEKIQSMVNYKYLNSLEEDFFQYIVENRV